jgi:hypothetical protein
LFFVGGGEGLSVMMSHINVKSREINIEEICFKYNVKKSTNTE